MLTAQELEVRKLGGSRFASPLQGSRGFVFVNDGRRIRYQHRIGTCVAPAEAELSFEEAGPRERIFFEPAQTTAAVVTCGGLSPGLNNVIRAVFSELRHNYGVPRIFGIRNGYAGLNPAAGPPPIELQPQDVEEIDKLGGTVLGSSRGQQPPEAVVDFLEHSGIDLLFCIGGDGTQRGAHAICEEVARRGLSKAVVGIPKTIDNDIPFVWMTFGYLTALEKAEEVLRGAHVEARGAPNGIAIVKLMGRNAGFIAAGAAMASDEANFVLVPEVPFPLEGPGGFLDALQRRMAARGHALIVVAEGAGQHLLAQSSGQRDASGNVLFEDIGVFLRVCRAGNSRQCEIHRSQLLDPQRAGQRLGPDPGQSNGTRRGPRRDGRPDRRADRLPPQRIDPRAAHHRDRTPAPVGVGQRPVDGRAQHDRPAAVVGGAMRSPC